MQSTENNWMEQDEALPRNEGGLRYPGAVALFVIRTLVGAACYLRHRLSPAPVASGASPFMEFAGWLTCFYPWILLGPVVFRIRTALSTQP